MTNLCVVEMKSPPTIGELRISHMGYGHLVESRWTGSTWFTVRSEGPYTGDIFTPDERIKAMREWHTTNLKENPINHQTPSSFVTKLFALSLLLLPSCSSFDKEPESWRADSSFTTEERKILADAEVWVAGKMGRASSGIIFDVPHEDYDRLAKKTIWKRSRESYWGPDGCQGGASTWLGWKTMYICIREDQKQYRAALAAHEFAHAMGIDSHLEPMESGLMNPVPVELVWTEADQKLCDKLGACW